MRDGDQDHGKGPLNRRDLLKTGTVALASWTVLQGQAGQAASPVPSPQLPSQVQANMEGRIETPPLIGQDANGHFLSFRTLGKTLLVRFALNPQNHDIPLFFDPVVAPGDPPPTQRVARPRRIRIPASPVLWLTPEQFVDPKKLPGRAEAGFVGASVVATGVYDLAKGWFEAHFLDVIPNETVIVGPLTAHGAPGPVAVCGVPIELSADPRYPAERDPQGQPVYLNSTWFPIQTTNLRVNDPLVGPTAVDGYAVAGKLITQKFVSGEDGVLTFDPAASPRVSVDRIKIRDDGASFSIEGRGGVTVAHVPAGTTPSLNVFRIDIDADGNESRRTLNLPIADIKTVGPNLARWRLKRAVIPKSSGVTRTPPEKVAIVMTGRKDPQTGRDVEVVCATDIREA